MAIPVELRIATWASFGVVFLLAVLISVCYIRHFKHKRHSERFSTIIAILALTVAIFTIAVVPIDIFTVSFLKNDDGSYKEWAASSVTRDHIAYTLLCCYYVLFSGMTAFIFLVIPFTIFYYEEQDEDSTVKDRLCRAMKYTVVIVLFAAVLLTIGAFVPLQKIPDPNATDWKNFQYLLTEFELTKGETALYFLMGFIMLVGMLGFIFYTAFGMVALPVDLIRGNRSAQNELEEIRDTASANRAQLETLRRKRQLGKKLSSRERRLLEDLRDEDTSTQLRECRLEAVQRRFCYKYSCLWRPLQIALGIIWMLVTVFVFVSLIINCIDRVLHSRGYKTGYILPSSTYPNPIDIVLLFAQELFPLDYILFAGLVFFFIFSSMAGIRRIGIWFCCVKMYKIRFHRTKPQGLLFLCMYIMFLLLAVNLMLHNLAPDYMTYGHQKFIPANSTTPKQCSTSEAESDCTMTVAMALMTKFVYQLWFFGICYFWSNWLFLLVVVIGVIYSLARRRPSVIHQEVDSSDSEMGEDEELLLP